MKSFLKWTFWIVSVLLLLFFGIIAAGTLYARKVAPWPDPVPGVSLTPSRPFLAASNIGPDNAYYYFRQMTNEYVGRAAYQRDINTLWANGWKPGVFTNIEAWMAGNHSDRWLYARASGMSNSQAASEHSFGGGDINIATFDFHRGLVFEIARALDEQSAEQALSLCEQLLRNGANLERGVRGYERAYISNAEMTTCKLLRGAAVHGRLTPVEMRRSAELLRWRDQHYEPSSETMRYEVATWVRRRPMISSIPLTAIPVEPDWSDLLAKMVPPVLYPLLGSTRKASERHVVAWGTHLIAGAEDPTVARRTRALASARFYGIPMRNVLCNDPMANVACVDLNQSMYLLHLSAAMQARLRQTYIVLAVEQWRLDHGDKPPGTIGELCPAYLAEIPEDPFAKGARLLYRVDGEAYVIYSVGLDGTDEGGDVEGSSPRDVGWRVALDRTAGTKSQE